VSAVFEVRTGFLSFDPTEGFLTDLIASAGLLQFAMVAGVVVLAAILRAFTGFGFGLAAVPVFALLMSPEQAVVLSVSLTFSVSLLTVRTYWGQVTLRPLTTMLAMGIAGTVAGAILLASISAEQFRIGIGIVVILACIMLGLYRPGRFPAGRAAGGLAGLLAGLMNGAFAIPGPPVIIYTMATEPDPARSRAFLLTFFLFMAGAALLVYAVGGFITATSGLHFLLAFPAMYLGDKLGYQLFRRYGTARYRQVALLLLFALGLAITLEALW
jgi:uncharacterized membrane protein YfcA